MRNKRIKERLLLLIILAIITISSIGCNHKKESITISNEPLTMEEKLEDFEHAYSIIKENYPFLEVNKRLYGVDWLGNKKEYIERIKNTDTDNEFIEEFGNIIRELNNGHTHVLHQDQFKWYYSVYTNPKFRRANKSWVNILEDKVVLNRYDFDESLAEETKDLGYFGNTKAAFKTDIIVPNEVAYLKINMMDGGRVEEDGKEIRKFYEKVKDYEKLIIDIRGNSGGSDSYWRENVVSALTKEPISTRNYILIRGDYGKPFYRARGIRLKSVNSLDENILKQMPEEVEEDFDMYWISKTTIKPKNSIDFNGKIFLLVDKWVYSSSESFAVFCKGSGFATLVGETTGGDGIGIDPLLFSLPNSGLVIRFSSLLALNGDFTINEEVKTVPNVKVNAAIIRDYKYDEAIKYVINSN